MTPNEAKSLLDGDAVLYQGRNATFLCLTRVGVVPTSTQDEPTSTI